jgi:hypothetical protein
MFCAGSGKSAEQFDLRAQIRRPHRNGGGVFVVPGEHKDNDAFLAHHVLD